ncbi:class I SAM-dependent methyltransferase [Rhodohalobacter barkolensis]|uniref:Class I SAM-dependent methyltransferase n=1 Tax=Rhodohalobacter barkolensis TaxID=2053187 RepID=A0A2N0VI59_9BACT|nr:class I SAM-dependent methyltransferase [Rhodohalobacter barkolensis]PKD43870.1 class I SAM-dependent methyltransferase [Rhodohalobacter barkolensis]
MSRFDDEAKDWDTPESQERARAIANAIRSHVPLSTDLSAFDYGCGTGQLSFELRDKIGPITLADNSIGMLDVLREKIKEKSIHNMKPIRLDLTHDPLPGEKFDLVYTSMTLHHIPDTRFILKQFYELLNPGGYLCIADLDKEDGSFHGHDVDDVHKGFDQKELASVAKNAGFTNINFSTAYTMEKEVNEQGDTKQFPIFLMLARKI